MVGKCDSVKMCFSSAKGHFKNSYFTTNIIWNWYILRADHLGGGKGNVNQKSIYSPSSAADIIQVAFHLKLKPKPLESPWLIFDHLCIVWPLNNPCDFENVTCVFGLNCSLDKNKTTTTTKTIGLY